MTGVTWCNVIGGVGNRGTRLKLELAADAIHEYGQLAAIVAAWVGEKNGDGKIAAYRIAHASHDRCMTPSMVITRPLKRNV
jgi:hypothetical protein